MSSLVPQSLRTIFRAVLAAGVLAAPSWTAAFAQAAEPASTIDDSVTVRAASRHPERLVEAPAGVAALSHDEIARRATEGAAPRVLAAVPGVELAQGGLYDYNLNLRGFGGSTNRRVLVLIDGRDPSQPVFPGAQEWGAFPVALEELTSAELVYGPGAALYGAGAYNGVLDLRTRRVGDALGGHFRIGLGSLDLLGADVRLARQAARGAWRVAASWEKSRDFAESRVDGVEYAPGLLPTEAIAPVRDRVEVASLGLRWDHDLDAEQVLTVDGGTATADGVVIVTGLGRLQRLDVERPWARVEWSTPRWSSQVAYSGRRSPEEVSLAAGSAISLDSYRGSAELQANFPLWLDRVLVVGGLSWMRQEVDSRHAGAHTLFEDVVGSDHHAGFAQGSVDLTATLRAVASVRYDDSDLHDPRWSPRAALVWQAAPAHSVRVSWGEAFQSPSLSEKYVFVPVAPPLDLSGIETALAPLLAGQGLGLERVPLLAVGNEALEEEVSRTTEVGWIGGFGSGTMATLNLYRSELRGFTTNLLPLFGTSLGQLRPIDRFRPEGISTEAQALLDQILASALPPGFVVAQDSQGRPIIPFLSFGRFGRVETTGAELGLIQHRGAWRFELGYSWFDAEVEDEAPEAPLAPNRAEHMASLTVDRRVGAADVGVTVRWHEDFTYRSGVFFGPVDGAVVTDLSARIPVGPWVGEVSVSNLFGETYYEAFGGDLIDRRAVLRLRRSW